MLEGKLFLFSFAKSLEELDPESDFIAVFDPIGEIYPWRGSKSIISIGVQTIIKALLFSGWWNQKCHSTWSTSSIMEFKLTMKYFIFGHYPADSCRIDNQNIFLMPKLYKYLHCPLYYMSPAKESFRRLTLIRKPLLAPPWFLL